jgi:hypothetical protein
MKLIGVKSFDARVFSSEVRRPYLSVRNRRVDGSKIDRNRRVDGIVPGVRKLVDAL